MTQDDFDDPQLEIQTPEPRRPAGSGRMVAAGVVGALALGVGLGLWARPAPPPEASAPVAPEDLVRPALQIVMDDSPAPIGPLLEVLPGDAVAAHPAPPTPEPEPVAPRRAAAGLMKVDAIVAAAPLLQTAVKIEAAPRKAEPRPEPKPETKPAKPLKPDKAKADAKLKAEKLKVAEAKAKKAQAETAAKLAKTEKAKADKAKAAKLAKAQKLEKAQAAKLARAEAARKAEKAETRRLAALAKAAKLAKADAAKKKAQLAQAKAAKKPAVQKASTAPAPKTKIAPPPARKPVPRGEGPMRVARNDACASSDPGEAAVCADRGLTARDRQMQQAYRNAEAAGVPASALRRQQTRWLQARAAAAREAPWAVEDVYTARISELNDLTRDAREN